jgi:uncharacterized membrane protein
MTDMQLAERTTVSPASLAAAHVRERPWPFVVWSAMFVWAALLFALFRSYFLEFRLARYDLGNMVQAVWSTSEGRPLETTLGTGEQLSRLAAHVDPILVLLAPLWMLAPSPLTLAFAQIAACALGALPVFWLGRRHFGSERPAALLALAYLAFPWLAWAALDAVHAVTFAIPLFLFAIWYLDSDRLVPFAICAVLAVTTGELMGLPLACLGLWYWLSRGHRVSGLATAGFGLAWTVLCIYVVVPAFWGDESQFYAYFDHVGGSPEGVVGTALTDPGAILAALFTGRDLLFLLALGAPLGAAFLLAPALAVAALPLLVANLLSSMGAHTDPRVHAVAGVIPFLVAASVVGLARLPADKRLRAVTIVFALSVVLSVFLGPWQQVPGPRPLKTQSWPAEHVRALRDAVALVPPNAPVAATNAAGSHLSARKHFFSVPLVRNAEWVVVDERDAWVPIRPQGSERSTWGSRRPSMIGKLTDRLRASPRWRTVFERSDIVVFQRIRPSQMVYARGRQDAR